MRRILISACLMGQPVRYDGKAKALFHSKIDEWTSQDLLVPLCPELAGGLGVPRLGAEIENGLSGEDVWEGKARVFDSSGTDVTSHFLTGAEAALALAQARQCSVALLKEGSPSCGSNVISDGTFRKIRHPGSGVTAARLRQNGITVFSENEIEALAAFLHR